MTLKVPSGASVAAAPTAAPAPATAAPQPQEAPRAPATGGPRILNPQAAPAPVRPAAATPPAATPPTPPTKVASAGPLTLPAAPHVAGKFRWPAKGPLLAGFGKRPDGAHNDGINIAVPAGADIAAAEQGTVAYAGSEIKAYGNLILIRHEGGWVTAYAHASEILVKRGDAVTRGQVIAKAGATGTVDQSQVHFELRQGSKPVDPAPHMEK
jgi:murein DD-endopeptidase MepM/ murein hydrolase activator NlpD